MNVGQAEVAARVAVRKALVVESQQVEQRGVQVMHVNLVLLRAEAELGRAV